MLLIGVPTALGIPSGLIQNPGFESGTSQWGFYTNGGGTFSVISPGFEGNYTANLALNNAGTNIQLYQTGVTLEPDTRYRLSFAGYSTIGHDVNVRLIKHVSPYTNYGLDFTANLGTNWQNFTTEFNTTGFTGTVNDGRLMFWLAPFATAGDTYNFDNVRLEKVDINDTTPPTVTGNEPTGTNVPVTTQISVTFSEAMNQTSVENAFDIDPSVNGTFTWSGDTMNFISDADLASSTKYNVTIGTGAEDLAGNNLATDHLWNFTTAAPDNTAPTVIGNTPTGTDVPVTTTITVTFNESMNKTSAESAFLIAPATNGSFAWNGNIMTFIPTSNLASDTNYNVTIRTGAMDLSNNNLTTEYSWQFTTEVVPTNVIQNPGFESGTSPWLFYTSGTGTFSVISPGFEGNYAANLVLNNAGTNIQLYQTGVTLEPDTRYRLSFAGYSTTGNDVNVRLIKHVSPYTNYGLDFTANLGTNWQNFTTEFNTTGFTGTVNDGRLMFWLAPFATAGDTYNFDNVRLEKVDINDTTPPTVTGNEPTGTNVPVTTQISVTFSEAMN
ncbi:MAG: Ig-like domain-containing protein, partial [Methanosarcinales archaeon]|nr:Ig-like domain-containing protein [Methanosarcinales archaeon]